MHRRHRSIFPPSLRAAPRCARCGAGLSTLGVTLGPAFQRAEWQAYRAALFVGLGLWGIIPMLHGLAANAGEAAMVQAMSLDVLMGAIYIVSCWCCCCWLVV